MATKKHVFISLTGDPLPRWRLAYPRATMQAAAQLPPVLRAEFIWLRLQSGLDHKKQIDDVRSRNSDAAMIILSDMPNDDEAMAVFTLGARGYANAHAASDTLKQIVNVIDQGGLWIGVSLMQRLLVGVNQLSAPVLTRNQHKLTGRELEVAKAIAAGASNKEVARQLNITERTVKAHVSGLFTKLRVSDRLQLALKMRELAP